LLLPSPRVCLLLLLLLLLLLRGPHPKPCSRRQLITPRICLLLPLLLLLAPSISLPLSIL
jgi:hypothetical protein